MKQKNSFLIGLFAIFAIVTSSLAIQTGPKIQIKRTTSLKTINDCSEVYSQKKVIDLTTRLREIQEIYNDSSIEMTDSLKQWIREHSSFIDINGNSIPSDKRDGIIYEKVGTIAKGSISSIDSTKRSVEEWSKWQAKKRCLFIYGDESVNGNGETYTCVSTKLKDGSSKPYHTGVIFSDDPIFYSKLLTSDSINGVIEDSILKNNIRLMVQHSDSCLFIDEINNNVDKFKNDLENTPPTFNINNPEEAQEYIYSKSINSEKIDENIFLNKIEPNKIIENGYTKTYAESKEGKSSTSLVFDPTIFCELVSSLSSEVNKLENKTQINIDKIELTQKEEKDDLDFSLKINISPSFISQLKTNYIKDKAYSEGTDQADVYGIKTTVGSVWSKLCSPIESLENPASPQGGEVVAAEVLLHLGYRYIPQTKPDGDYTQGINSYDEGLMVGTEKMDDGSYKDIGEVPLFQKYKFQSHFGSFGVDEKSSPYLSTGIQNKVYDKVPYPSETSTIAKDNESRENLTPRRVHKFYYETHWEDIKKGLMELEKKKVLSKYEEDQLVFDFTGNEIGKGWTPSWDISTSNEIEDIILKNNQMNTSSITEDDIVKNNMAFFIDKSSPYRGFQGSDLNEAELIISLDYLLAEKNKNSFNPLLEVSNVKIEVSNNKIKVNETIIEGVGSDTISLKITLYHNKKEVKIETNNKTETVTITENNDVRKSIVVGSNVNGYSLPSAKTNQFYGIIDNISVSNGLDKKDLSKLSIVEREFSKNSGSSNPMVKGYIFMTNAGSDKVAIGNVSRFDKDIDFSYPLRSDSTSSTTGWGDSPFKNKTSSSNMKTMSLLELYNLGFNWDDRKCAISGDTDCIFAYSELSMGAGCGGHTIGGEMRELIKNNILNTGITKTKGELYRLSGSKTNYEGSAVITTPYTCWLAGPQTNGSGSHPADSYKADVYASLTYDEMRDTKVNFYQDDVGILLRPGYFFSLENATAGGDTYWVSQMKLKRYSRFPKNGILKTKVKSNNELETINQYKESTDICTKRGLSTTIENGQVLCTGDICENGLSFDIKTGSCTPKCKTNSSGSCISGEFENIGGFGDVDVLVTVDLSGSTKSAHGEIRNYVKKLAETMSSPNVGLYLWSTKVTTDKWMTDKSSFSTYTDQLTYHHGTSDKRYVQTYIDILNARKKDFPKRKLIHMHFGDDDGTNGASGSTYLNSLEELKKTGAIHIAINPETCPNCAKSKSQKDYANINGGQLIDPATDNSMTTENINFKKILNDILPCRGTNEECGKKNNKCSLADLEKKYTRMEDGTWKKEITSKCKFLATEATSVDFLKQLSSEIIMTNSLKDLATDDKLMPQYITGLAIPKELKPKYEKNLKEDGGSWKRGSDGEFFDRLNKTFMSTPTYKINKLVDIVKNYNLKKSAKKNFKKMFGFEMDNLPYFGIDVLNINYTVDKEIHKNLSMQGESNSMESGPILCDYKNTGRELIYEKIEYTDDAKTSKYRSEWVCGKIVPVIDDILEYDLDPFLNSKYISYNIEIKGDKTSVLYTSGSTYREDMETSKILPDGKGIDSTEERKTEIKKQIQEYIDLVERKQGINSLTLKELKCGSVDVSVDNVVVTAVDDNNVAKDGFIKGIIKCSDIVSGQPRRSKTVTNRFIPTSISSLNSQLQDEAPVKAKLGEIGLSEPYKKCVKSSTLGETTDISIIDKMKVDKISKQVYRIPSGFNTNPTIYIPYVTTADYIKKEAIKKEIIYHTSKLIGTVIYISGDFKRDKLGNVITDGDGKIGEWLSKKGKNNVAQQISTRLESTYPYEKSSFLISLNYPSDYKESITKPLKTEDLYYTIAVNNKTYESSDWAKEKINNATITREKKDSFENKKLRFNNQNDGFVISQQALLGNIAGTYEIIKEELSGPFTSEEDEMVAKQNAEDILIFKATPKEVRFPNMDIKTKSEVLSKMIKEMNTSGCSYLTAKDYNNNYKEGWGEPELDSRYISFDGGITAKKISENYVFKFENKNKVAEEKKIQKFLKSNLDLENQRSSYAYGSSGLVMGGGILSSKIKSGEIRVNKEENIRTVNGKRIWNKNWIDMKEKSESRGAIITFDNPVDPSRIYISGKTELRENKDSQYKSIPVILKLTDLYNFIEDKDKTDKIQIDILKQDLNGNILKFKWFSNIVNYKNNSLSIKNYFGNIYDKDLNSYETYIYNGKSYNYVVQSSTLYKIGENGIYIDLTEKNTFKDNQKEEEKRLNNIIVETLSGKGKKRTLSNSTEIIRSIPTVRAKYKTRKEILETNNIISTSDYFNKTFTTGPLTNKVKVTLKIRGLYSDIIYHINGKKSLLKIGKRDSFDQVNARSQWTCDSKTTKYEQSVCGSLDGRTVSTKEKVYEILVDVNPEEENEFGIITVSDYIYMTGFEIDSEKKEYKKGIITNVEDLIEYYKSTYLNISLIDKKTGSKVMSNATVTPVDVKNLYFNKYSPGSFIELTVNKSKLMAMENSSKEVLDSCEKAYGPILGNSDGNVSPSFYLAYDDDKKTMFVEQKIINIPLFDIGEEGSKTTDIRNIKTVILEDERIMRIINCSTKGVKVDNGEVYCDRSTEKNVGFEKIAVINTITGEPEVVFELNDTEEYVGRGEKRIKVKINYTDKLGKKKSRDGLEPIYKNTSFISINGDLIEWYEPFDKKEEGKLYIQRNGSEKSIYQGKVKINKNIISINGTGKIELDPPKNVYLDKDKNRYEIVYGYKLKEENGSELFGDYYQLVKKSSTNQQEELLLEKHYNIIGTLSFDSKHNNDGKLIINKFEEYPSVILTINSNKTDGWKYVDSNNEKYNQKNSSIMKLINGYETRIGYGYIDEETGKIYLESKEKTILDTFKHPNIYIETSYKTPFLNEVYDKDNNIYSIENNDWDHYGEVKKTNLNGTIEYLGKGIIDNDLKNGVSTIQVYNYITDENKNYLYTYKSGNKTMIGERNYETEKVKKEETLNLKTIKKEVVLIKGRDEKIIEENISDYTIRKGQVYKRLDPMTISLNLSRENKDRNNTYRKIDLLNKSKIIRIKSTKIPTNKYTNSNWDEYQNIQFKPNFEKKKYIYYKVKDIKKEYGNIIAIYTNGNGFTDINVKTYSGIITKITPSLKIGSDYEEFDLTNISDTSTIGVERTKELVLLKGLNQSSEDKYKSYKFNIEKNELFNYQKYKDRLEKTIELKKTQNIKECNAGVKVISGNNVLTNSDSKNMYTSGKNNVSYSSNDRPTKLLKIDSVINENGILIEAPEIKKNTNIMEYKPNFYEWTPKKMHITNEKSYLLKKEDFLPSYLIGDPQTTDLFKIFKDSKAKEIKNIFDEKNKKASDYYKTPFLNALKYATRDVNDKTKIYWKLRLSSGTKYYMDSMWKIEKENSIHQFINGGSIGILSKRNYGRGKYESTIRIQNSGKYWYDDDLVGLIIGYKNEKNYDMVQWKGAINKYGKNLKINYNSEKTPSIQYVQIRNGVKVQSTNKTKPIPNYTEKDVIITEKCKANRVEDKNGKCLELKTPNKTLKEYKFLNVGQTKQNNQQIYGRFAGTTKIKETQQFGDKTVKTNVSFRFYAFDSWDGSGEYGYLKINGKLLWSKSRSSYTNCNGWNNFNSGQGDDPWGGQGNQRCYVDVDLKNIELENGLFDIEIGSTINQGISDESWGISDIKMEQNSCPTGYYRVEPTSDPKIYQKTNKTSDSVFSINETCGKVDLSRDEIYSCPLNYNLVEQNNVKKCIKQNVNNPTTIGGLQGVDNSNGFISGITPTPESIKSLYGWESAREYKMRIYRDKDSSGNDIVQLSIQDLNGTSISTPANKFGNTEHRTIYQNKNPIIWTFKPTKEILIGKFGFYNASNGDVEYYDFNSPEYYVNECTETKTGLKPEYQIDDVTSEKVETGMCYRRPIHSIICKQETLGVYNKNNNFKIIGPIDELKKVLKPKFLSSNRSLSPSNTNILIQSHIKYKDESDSKDKISVEKNGIFDYITKDSRKELRETEMYFGFIHEDILGHKINNPSHSLDYFALSEDQVISLSSDREVEFLVEKDSSIELISGLKEELKKTPFINNDNVEIGTLISYKTKGDIKFKTTGNVFISKVGAFEKAKGDLGYIYKDNLKLDGLYPSLVEEVKKSPLRQIKIYPRDFAVKRAQKESFSSSIKYNTTELTEKVDLEVESAINKTKEICNGFIEYNDEFSLKLREISEMYLNVKTALEDKSIIKDIYNYMFQNTYPIVGIKGVGKQSLKWKRRPKFIFKLKGPHPPEVRQSWIASHKGEDALYSIINKECSEPSTINIVPEIKEEGIKIETPICKYPYFISEDNSKCLDYDRQEPVNELYKEKTNPCNNDETVDYSSNKCVKTYTVKKTVTKKEIKHFALSNYSASQAENKCKGIGMELFVPRSKSHIQEAINKYGVNSLYIMGIYPKWNGATCSYKQFNSSHCFNWGPKNGGDWFVGTIANCWEPNGDNNVDASMYYSFNQNGDVSWYNDIYGAGYRSNSGGFLCSTLLSEQSKEVEETKVEKRDFLNSELCPTNRYEYNETIKKCVKKLIGDEKCKNTHTYESNDDVCILKSPITVDNPKLEKVWDLVDVYKCPIGSISKSKQKGSRITKNYSKNVDVYDDKTCELRSNRMSSIRLKTILKGEKEGRMLCDVVKEYLLQGSDSSEKILNPIVGKDKDGNSIYSKDLNIKIPDLKGFGHQLPTIQGVGKRSLYNPIYLNRFYRDRGLLWMLTGEKYHFSVEGYKTIASKATRILKYHERSFMEQASGIDQIREMEECVAGLGNNGYFKIDKNSFSTQNYFLDLNKIKHLIPSTLEIRDVSKDSFYEVGKYLNEIKQILPDKNDEGLLEGYIKTDLIGNMDKSIGETMCANIIKKNVAIGHRIFNNPANRMFLEGFNTNGGQNSTVPRLRVLEKFNDSKGNPNWLQGKVCKSGYVSTQVVFNRNKLKIMGSNCDNSIYATNCVETNGTPGVSLFSLVFGSGKAKLRRYFENIVTMKDTVCGISKRIPTSLNGKMATSRDDSEGIFYVMKGHKETKSKSSSSLLDELEGRAKGMAEDSLDKAMGGHLSTAKFLISFFSSSSGPPMVEKVIEKDILLKSHGVDKANTSITIAENEGETNRQNEMNNRVLIFSSINLESLLTNKKTGAARVLTGDEEEDKASAPDMQINDQTPLEMLLSECMDWKGQYTYRKPEKNDDFEYYTKRSLVKEYKNENKDFLFKDPRTGKERAVRYCSDILYKSEETYQSKERIDPRKARREYLNELFDEDLDFTKRKVSISEEEKNSIGLNTTNIRMDGGSEIISKETPGGIVFERKFTKAKEKGNEVLRDLTSGSSFGKANPEVDQSIKKLESSLTDQNTAIGKMLGDTKKAGGKTETLSDTIKKLEGSVGDGLSGLITSILGKNGSNQKNQVDGALKVLKTYNAIKMLKDMGKGGNSMLSNTDVSSRILGKSSVLLDEEDQLSNNKSAFIERSGIEACSDGVCDKNLSKTQLLNKVQAFDKSLESGKVFDRSKNLKSHRSAVNRARERYMGSSQYSSSNSMLSELDKEYNQEIVDLENQMKEKIKAGFGNVYTKSDSYRQKMNTSGYYKNGGVQTESTRNIRLKTFESDMSKDGYYSKLGGNMLNETKNNSLNTIGRNQDSALRQMAGDIDKNVFDNQVSVLGLLKGQDPQKWMEGEKGKLMNAGVQAQKKLVKKGIKFLKEGTKQLINGIEELVNDSTDDTDNTSKDPFLTQINE